MMQIRLYKARKQLRLTQKQVADILGIGQNAYSMIETGKISLTTKNRSILAEKLYINPTYLMEGRGEMMLSSEQVASVGAPQSTTCNHERKQVPYYSKPVTGSVVISFDDMARDEPEYYIDLAPFNDCTFYRPIFGESMVPRYNPGDILACKKIHNKKFIQYGESYLCVIAVDGDFYETVKILRKNILDPSTAILKPYNEAFDETTIPIDNIRELYVIKGKIERNI